MTTVARLVTWACVGLAMAIALSFLLYRMTLPVKPFIYQAF